MRKVFFILMLAAGCISGAVAQQEKGNVLDLKHSLTDNAIVYPESFETDTQKLFEGWFLKNYTSTDDRYATEKNPVVSDSEIIERLNAMPTLIEMPYNKVVRSYIDNYMNNGRAQVATLLGLSLYYMPIFEQALEEQGLPLELKYLPMIESGLDPNAVSKHGATGLWQFMLGTAKGLGMEVNSLVDERRDPYISSELAATYLKGLYDTYGDWSLAIAAYNCGPNNVNKAIRRAGGDAKDHDFWSIYNYLSPETRGYVPMFIAANYVMNYYPQHNISPVLPVKPLVTDTIHVSERIHFNQIASVLDLPLEELRVLNPQFRADIIPGTVDYPCTLILPSQQVHAYIMSEDDIRKFEADKYAQRSTVDPGEAPADALFAVEETDIWGDTPNVKNEKVSSSSEEKMTTTIVHKVVAGETLASIARQYEVTPEEIKAANNLRRNAVRIGQQLRITTSSPQAVMENTVAAVTNATPKAAATEAPKKKNTTTATSTKKSNPTTHKVKNGENLSSISKKYGVSVAEIKKANGMKDDNIRAGSTLKIPTKATKSTGTTSKKKKRKR